MINLAKTIRIALFIVLSLIVQIACTRVTDLKPEGRAQVVVTCVLSEEPRQSLTLDLTDIAASEDRAALSNAEITLYDESEGKEVGRFLRGDGSVWYLDYAAIPEHKYRLEILIPGREDISATTAMPSNSNIVYCFGLWYQGTMYSIESLPEGPLWVMGVNHDPGTGEHKIAEKIATSLESVDSYNVSGEVFHAFDFFEEIATLKEENDFFYPSVEGRPLYDRMFRIPAGYETSRTAKDPDGFFSVAGYFRTEFDPYWFERNGFEFTEENGYVLFISPSKEYDRFLQDASSKKRKQGAEESYAAILSRENVYTNVVNGLGVFGAQTSQKLPWNDKPVAVLGVL